VRRSSGISSIYGFIVIFLLSMASMQVWSSAVSSMAQMESASNQGIQLDQLRSMEHVGLSESGSNLTIRNDGEIPTTLEFIRLIGVDGSRTLTLGTELAVGSSLNLSIPPGDGVQVVTSLGNVWTLSDPDLPGESIWSGELSGGGNSNAQIFESPYYTQSFFLSDGSSVYSFSISGTQEWSFDAGYGFVTDVLPLADGDVYVAVGYGTSSNTAELFELDHDGSVIHMFQVRLFQTANGGSSQLSISVTKGADAYYAFYDGMLYSENGGAIGTQSDYFPPLGSDDSGLYFYSVAPESYSDGVCQPPGDGLEIYGYTAARDVEPKVTWDDYLYLGSCSQFPPQLIGSAVDGGTIAFLLSSPAYVASPDDVYPAQGPYLATVSAGGNTPFVAQLPNQSYTSVATNGTDVYLAVPQAGEVQVYSLASKDFQTFNVGMQPSQLLFECDRLFAISGSVVKVFDSSMKLQDTIDLSPYSLASYGDSFLEEPALQAPSFLALNATSYAALVANGTSDELLVGTF
jgi:hypothetical protein